MFVDQMFVGEHRLWIRTLDRSTRVNLPESVFSRMFMGRDNTGQNTDKEHTSNPRTKIKITYPPKIESRPPGGKV